MRLGHAAYCALYVAPIGISVSFNPAFAYWLLSGVAIVVCVAWLWRLGAWQRVVALLVNASTSFANLLLGASLYVQGVGFNAQFFYHLDGETFAIARQAYAVFFSGAWIYWLVMCFSPLLLGWPRRGWTGKQLPGRVWAVVGLVGVVAYAPLLSLISLAFDEAVEPVVPIAVTDNAGVVVEPVPLQDPKSLVLIFAESLEATYSREDIFGDDLTPRLTALAERAVSFGDIRQVDQTGSTIAGMVGALCSLPLRFRMPWTNLNTLLANVDVPLPGEACLGDVLVAQGYRTVFMGGAPLGFAGKGKYLAAHGFQERYGTAHFQPLLEDPEYRSKWGIHDDTLIDHATRKLDELAGEGSPFALMLLTLDTHHPSGFPSASCPARRSEESAMEYAIRCSDLLLGDFIESTLSRHDGVVVALFSDHLAHRNELFATLRNNADARRLRFAVWGSDIEARRISQPGTHYDVMPTLLDLMGVEAWLRHNLGASLIRYDSPWFSSDVNPTLTRSQSLPAIHLEADSTILFDVNGPTIQIDGRRVVATSAGLPLNNAIFGMRLDERGNVVAFRDSEFFDQFMGDAEEGIWIGVSTNDEFNDRIVPDESAKLVYFAGCFDTNELVAEPLWWRADVTASSVLDGCRSAN